MSDWRERWIVTIASDVATRDGIGWEFADVGQRDAWMVFREDGGDFPVFSSARGDGELPPLADLKDMTRTAVGDLLTAAGLADDVGWITSNITSLLMLASMDVVTWEGEEWALEGTDGAALTWAGADDARVPFDWLRAKGTDRDAVLRTYQDDGVFGLLVSPGHPTLPEIPTGELRPRRNLPLVTGRIEAVEVAYDTIVEDGACPGLVTEVLLHGKSHSTLLIAAEAHSRGHWALYDESVVALTGLAQADRLDWRPPRRAWRSTHRSGG